MPTAPTVDGAGCSADLTHFGGQRAPYGARYAALAERLGCRLRTADDRVRDAVRPVFPRVRSLSEPS